MATARKYSQHSAGQQFNQDELTNRIRKVAQENYERRNREPGHELEDWLSAERQVKKELGIK